jgi:hypothetical protein
VAANDGGALIFLHAFKKFFKGAIIKVFRVESYHLPRCYPGRESAATLLARYRRCPQR